MAAFYVFEGSSFQGGDVIIIVPSISHFSSPADQILPPKVFKPVIAWHRHS